MQFFSKCLFIMHNNTGIVTSCSWVVLGAYNLHLLVALDCVAVGISEAIIKVKYYIAIKSYIYFISFELWIICIFNNYFQILDNHVICESYFV